MSVLYRSRQHDPAVSLPSSLVHSGHSIKLLLDCKNKGSGCWHPGLGKVCRAHPFAFVNKCQEMAWAGDQGHLEDKPGV